MNRWKLAVAGIVVLTGFLAVLMVGMHLGHDRGVPFLQHQYVWSIAIYEGETPLELRPSSKAASPVLTAAMVSDVRARFVADPFMVRDGSTWYMFFEVLNESSKHGDVGLATSPDGYRWTYQQIVLDEPFHLSYPEVFRWGDRYFMVPETTEANELRLYEAEQFPSRWRLVRALIGGYFADPTLVQYAGRWWLFAETNPLRNDVLRLYSSPDLMGPWAEHPASPIVRGDGDCARPGGRIAFFNGRLFRFAQDCKPRYGNRLRAFEITTLTPDAYQEQPVEMMPTLEGTGRGWNAMGMHQIDAHLLQDGHWIACVDGHRNVLSFALAY